jgi:hypothetical protein
MQNILIIFFQKLDLDSLFSHEFSPAPLALCDHQDCSLLNQQQKSELMRFFEKECPNGFSTMNPTRDNCKWALVIDGGPLLETRPSKANGTILDYAKQLLINTIIPEFKTYDRIDIVFDSDRSKTDKSFIKRHGHENKTQKQQYALKQSDVLDPSHFHEFVHSNRTKLAAVVRCCWSKTELADLLPNAKRLVIAGPQDEAVLLMNSNSSSTMTSYEVLCTLESNHVEADTRLFLHIYDIQMDDDKGRFDGIIIQSSDTDVFILSIAHVKLLMLSRYFIKKINTSTKSCTFIDVKEVARSLQIKWNITNPNILLSLHAISGCDTTSFTRNITKTNYFTTYLSNPDDFQDLIQFGADSSVKVDSIRAAERLLLSCYQNSRNFKSLTSLSSTSLSDPSTPSSQADISLNSLRKTAALKHFKNQSADICLKLPPTSDSFDQHCLRAWRQAFIWKQAFEPYDIISYYPMEDYGYQRTDDGELSIRWMTAAVKPTDVSLSKCMKCTSGCHRCKCAMNQMPCTPLCGCISDRCTNRTDAQVQ